MDAGDLLSGYFDLSETRDLATFKNAQKKLMVTGSHFVAVDQDGGVMATGYHASPCRDDLARTEDGLRFATGADPQLVLDGRQYGGFEVVLDEDGYPVSGPPNSRTCLVDYEQFPLIENPEAGFVVSGNNDPSGLSFDGSIANDGIYVGGPWDIGFRAERIDSRLGELVDDNAVSVSTMAEIRADVHSSGGSRWAPHIIEAVRFAQAGLLDGMPLEHESHQRLVSLYQANQERIDEAVERLENWGLSGFWAHSGVETVYNQPTEQERTDAVATTIFNFWLSAFKARLIDRLELRPAHRLTDDNTLGRLIDRVLSGRGVAIPVGRNIR